MLELVLAFIDAPVLDIRSKGKKKEDKCEDGDGVEDGKDGGGESEK